MLLRSDFPRSFQQYRPRSHKVFGIICSTEEKKYLLVRGRRANKWSFPKGHMEGRETALECAHRELWEETGIRLEGRIYSGTIKLSKKYVAKYANENRCEWNVLTCDYAINNNHVDCFIYAYQNECPHYIETFNLAVEKEIRFY